MGVGKIESERVRVSFAGGYIPQAFEIEADGGIVAAFGEIPAMNFCGAGVQREFPGAGRRGYAGIRFANTGIAVQRERAADAEIVAGDHAEEIRDGDFVPMNLDFGGLQASGGAGDFAANLQGTRGLQWNAAAPGLSFKPQLPAAGTHLLNAAGYVGEGEWTLFI